MPLRRKRPSIKFTHLPPKETGLEPDLFGDVHRVIAGRKEKAYSGTSKGPIMGAGYFGSVGTMELVPTDLRGETGWDVRRFIEPNHRGAGIGTQFLKEAERIGAKLKGAYVYARTGNPIAMYTYKQAGWVKIKQERKGNKILWHYSKRLR